MQRKPLQHARQSRHERGLGTEWDRVRAIVMRRDKWLCQPCQRAGRVTPATECDHIVPRSKGGKCSTANAEAICADCHQAKTASENGRTDRTRARFDASGRVIW